VASTESDHASFEYECDTKLLIEECLQKYSLFQTVDYSKTSSLTVTRSEKVAQYWKSSALRKGKFALFASSYSLSYF
jgi:hypothetical protein